MPHQFHSKERMESTEETEDIEKIDEMDDNRRGICVGGCVLSDDLISKVVQLATPTTTHANHRHLFTLARAVLTEERKQGKPCSEDVLTISPQPQTPTASTNTVNGPRFRKDFWEAHTKAKERKRNFPREVLYFGRTG